MRVSCQALSACCGLVLSVVIGIGCVGLSNRVGQAGAQVTATTATITTPGPYGYSITDFNKYNHCPPVKYTPTGTTVFGGYCHLSGEIPAGQSVTFVATELSFGAVTVHGTLVLSANHYASNPAAPTQVILSPGEGSVTVATGGRLETLGDPISGGVVLVNQPGGTVELTAAHNTFNEGSTSITNSGTFEIAHGAFLVLNTGTPTFTQFAGTLSVNGTMEVDAGTFTMVSGTESGNPVILNGTDLVEGPGVGRFTLYGDCAMRGNIPSGQTVTLQSADLSVDGTATVHGTLVLLAKAPNPGGSPGVMVHGSPLVIASGGRLVTSGGGGNYIGSSLTNSAGGTVDVTANTSFESAIEPGGKTKVVNSGAFEVANGAVLTFTSSGTFTQSAGTLSVDGTMEVRADTFTMAGGTETGNPVILNGTDLVEGPGVGRFTLYGDCALRGNIPTGQTVTVQSADVSVDGTATVHGTLVLLAKAPNPGGSPGVMVHGSPLVIAAGGRLVTSGGGGNYIGSSLTNSAGGTVDVTANTSFESAIEPGGKTKVVNSGAFEVANGAVLAFTYSSTFTQAGGNTNLTGGVISSPNEPFTLDGGPLRGHGTVTGHVVNGGTVSPGPGGGITISGPYQQTAHGTLAVSVGGGAAPGNQLVVKGAATLAGTLRVEATGVAAHKALTVVTYQSHSGRFSTLAGARAYTVTYRVTSAAVTFGR